MAAAAAQSAMSSIGEPTDGQLQSATSSSPVKVEPVVRHFKASELALPSATQKTIKKLATSFKKKGGYGGYDAIRKQVWDKFIGSVRRHCDNPDYFISGTDSHRTGLFSRNRPVHPGSCRAGSRPHTRAIAYSRARESTATGLGSCCSK